LNPNAADCVLIYEHHAIWPTGVWDIGAVSAPAGGFFARVVRNRRDLNLVSEKIGRPPTRDGAITYLTSRR
jgi:hypothetical protein